MPRINHVGGGGGEVGIRTDKNELDFKIEAEMY